MFIKCLGLEHAPLNDQTRQQTIENENTALYPQTCKRFKESYCFSQSIASGSSLNR
jgi:hypothetical protein